MSYIRDYMKFVELDEAHENYHVWSCFASLSAIVGRRLWIKRAYQTVYPTIYVVLVGPSGNRKTAAKDIAQSMLRDIGGIVFSSEATSREMLIKQMEENEVSFMVGDEVKSYAGMMICVTELKEFLTVDPARMINFLTAVYDQNYFDYSTIGRGQNVLVNPCLVMLACETPDWISDRLKDKIVSGGFSRRVIYVHETEHKRIIIKELPQEHKDARKRCIERAKVIQTLAGEFRWDPDAEAFYDDWYLNFKMPESAAMHHYFESKHTLALKVAMMVAVSEGNDLVMKKHYITAAIEFLESIEKNMPKVFSGGGRNELEAVGTKALDFLIKSSGPILERQLGAILWRDCRNDIEREQIMKHLADTKKVLRYKYNDHPWICAMEFLPKAVKVAYDARASTEQLSPPAEETAKGSAAPADQSHSHVEAPAPKLDPLQEFLQIVQGSSVGDTAAPPTESAESGDTSDPAAPALGETP